MEQQVVKINSVSSDADPILDLPSYIFDAQIINYNKNEEIFYKNVTINLLSELPKVLVSKSQPELVCFLELKKENDKIYRCDFFIWYFKKEKFFSFKDNKEIPRKIIFEILKWPRTVFDTVFDNLDHAKITDHKKILNAQNFYEPRVVPGADLV